MHRWIALLLPPTAWAATFGMLLSLNDTACVRGTRAPQAIALAIGLALSLTTLPLAAPHREQFLMRVALGLCVMFTLVLALMAVPLMLLGPCRT